MVDQGDKALPLAEVEAFDRGNVRRAADTRLFSADKSEGLTYAHRRVGEFVGAQWLAARADTPLKRRRLREQFSSHGLVPASLRGLHAWLARDAHFADAVIDIDPMGVVEYGDAEALTPDQARRLFAAIERLATENPRFMDWREYRASSLVTPALIAQVERVVRDPKAEFGLRALLLQQLNGTPTAEKLRDLLRQLMLDEAEPYGIRHASASALVSVGSEDWPTVLEQLRCQAREDSLRLAHELLDDIGLTTFSDDQIVKIILARDGLTLCPLAAEPERNTVMGFYRLAKHVPLTRIDGLLDLFTDYSEELLPEHAGREENDLIDLQYALILERLGSGSSVDPLRLWRWLEPFEEQSSYRREQGKQLAEWLSDNAPVRQAIQRYLLLDKEATKDIWQRAWPLHRDTVNLYPTQSDVIALLASMSAADARWREVLELGRTWGEEGLPLREAAMRFAGGRPEDLAWIEAKADRPVPDWERKQEEQARQRDVERTSKRAEHRREFLGKINGVAAGEYGLILAPAQAYLKRFQDMGDEVPAHERVAEWLGAEVAAASRDGFEAFLQARPPRPRAVEMVRSYAESKRWPAGDIIVAALAERVRTREQPFDGLSSERLAAGVFECWQGAIGDHAGLKELGPLLEAELRRRGQWRRVIRLFVEPQLRRRTQHVDRLWAIMRGDDGGLGADLAEDWLSRFPDMSGEAEVEMIDRLIRSNRRSALRALLADRLGRELNEERRRNWDAVALIIDFDTARARLGTAIEPELLWHLRARAGGGRYHHDGEGLPTFLSVDQLAWLIATFRVLWPVTGHPTGATTGDTNPWDASEHIRALITRLGNEVSSEAATALAKLRDAPEDGYTWALRTVVAEQRQKQADDGYISPTLDQIKAVLDAGPPANVVDLRAIVVDQLEGLNRRLRGSSEDEVRWFWQGDQPRSENDCRDLTVTLLRGHLVPLSVYPMDEADMPQGKRADIVFYHDAFWLPVEAKRQQHPDLWIAIEHQLERLYTGHWQAEGQGVFLVFWFGSRFNLSARRDGGPKPTTAAELQSAFDAHPAVKAGRVQVVVLDLSRPA
ncbi:MULTISPECIES: hypothetical protein [unclassified Sphingobium]|uniref:hypothetical protein n=1 Tax=unclassified Sphingobium TaxID=2611147 RepID=UPI0022254012|nr:MULTISPECIES: hypothetical protein [unclassified Sphingobium]MCW2411583.1 hypothetical protein [Sphingobium sp. B8D3D]MCW2416124.1 hypothetical protein [Sphingobium sp. B8D3A]